jgi:hypothetical protein
VRVEPAEGGSAVRSNTALVETVPVDWTSPSCSRNEAAGVAVTVETGRPFHAVSVDETPRRLQHRALQSFQFLLQGVHLGVPGRIVGHAQVRVFVHVVGIL